MMSLMTIFAVVAESLENFEEKKLNEKINKVHRIRSLSTQSATGDCCYSCPLGKIAQRRGGWKGEKAKVDRAKYLSPVTPSAFDRDCQPPGMTSDLQPEFGCCSTSSSSLRVSSTEI
ncbi:hypothetical protein DMENIID0001_055250 [Sergentomyia squamirostris]